MSPCAVEFRFNLADPLRYCCALVRTALRQPVRLLLRGPQPLLAELDLLLWTAQPGSFLPHVWADDPLAARTPVILAESPDLSQLGRIDALVHFGPDLLPGWQALPRIIELVGAHSADRPAARQRLRDYRAAGCAPQVIDLSAA